MSDIKVEETKPVVEEVKPVEEVAPVVPEKTEETTTTEAAPVAEATEEKKEEDVVPEVKEDPKPISEGLLEFKPPGILHMLMPSKRFFYLQEEPIAHDNLAVYLKKEKSDAAHSNAAHATVTGKGLLFFAKAADQKSTPSGILKLSSVTDVTPSGASKFTLKFTTGDFHFEGAERDSWVHTLKQKVAEAKETVESVVSSEEYKAALEKISKPAPKPVVAVKETTDKGKEKAEETKEAAEEDKEEAKEEAKEVKEEAKEEKEEVKEEAKKEKKEKKEKKAKKEDKDDDSSSSSSSEDEDEKKEEKKKAEASKKASERTSFLAPFFSKDKKEKDHKEKVAEVKEEEAKKDEPETIKEETTEAAPVIAPLDAAPVAEKTEEGKLEAPVEEVKAESATSGKAVKRQSFFGLGFKKAHTEKKAEKVEEEKTEEPAKEGEAPVEKSADAVAVPAAETTETRPTVASPKDSFMKLFHKKKEAEVKAEAKAEETAAAPAETAPAVEEVKTEEAVAAPAETAAPATETPEAVPSPGKEKRRSSFFGNFGKKKEGVTSDSETEEAKSPSSPLPKKLSGFLGRSKSKSGKSAEPKDAAPEAVPEVPEIETVTPVIETPAVTGEAPVVATEPAAAVEEVVPKPVQATA